jgi:hypothetical protein
VISGLANGEVVTVGCPVAAPPPAGDTVAVGATGLTVPVGVALLLSRFVHPTSTEPKRTTTMIAINSFFIQSASFCNYSLQSAAVLSSFILPIFSSYKFTQYAGRRHNALFAKA